MSTSLELFERFVKERKYLKNVSIRTVGWYWQAWRTWGVLVPGDVQLLCPSHLTDIIIAMRERGIAPVTVNTRLRVLNAWLHWLYEQEYLPKLLKAPRQTEEQKDPPTFDVGQLRTIWKGKPQNNRERRIATVVELILDTGTRIEEALQLKVEDVDLDDLTIRVFGKGRKHRVIPISLAGRKVLCTWMTKHLRPGATYVFETSTGSPLTYNNARRDFGAYCRRLGIKNAKLSFHPLRHTFATHYIRDGGDVFRLQRILGHTTLAMTRRYVTLQTRDLRDVHDRLSLLAKTARSGNGLAS